jgi:hypothetical protein
MENNALQLNGLAICIREVEVCTVTPLLMRIYRYKKDPVPIAGLSVVIICGYMKSFKVPYPGTRTAYYPLEYFNKNFMVIKEPS